MATIDNKEFIDKIIAANGQLYPEDPHEPVVTKIVEYTNAWGKLAWGVTFSNERDYSKYETESEWIKNPKIIFERGR